MKPTLLLILDGWGCAPAGPGNALSLSVTPTLDRLQRDYPHTCLACSGRAVGLPQGFMGNSEVGHMNIGAGRVVFQDMTRIDVAIEDGSFMSNPVLVQACATAKASGGAVHLLGLLSDGGVHSHLNHINALLQLAKAQGVADVFVHAFLDGRDTPPASGAGFMEKLLRDMDRLGSGKVASICGRYYAMDRDKRYERNALAYALLTAAKGEPMTDPVATIRACYAKEQFDEFVMPHVAVDAAGAPLARLRDGDVVIFFNFRADRARQLVQSLFDDSFAGFERPVRPKLAMLATMTEYDASFGLPVAFPPQTITDSLGEVLSRAGLRQLRLAETEKYAHVTYFLNCGREEPFPGEDRVLIPSPREVATYDLKPEMSVKQVADTLLERWGQYDVVICNLANLDMVGHTGSIRAAVRAAEAVDANVGRIVDAVLASGGRLLVTADHGNAEEMLGADGGIQTSHSLNPVPLVLVDGQGGARLRDGGKLADIAPTLLALQGLPQPAAMSGTSLLEGA